MFRCFEEMWFVIWMIELGSGWCWSMIFSTHLNPNVAVKMVVACSLEMSEQTY